jgi:hypothetical protein
MSADHQKITPSRTGSGVQRGGSGGCSSAVAGTCSVPQAGRRPDSQRDQDGDGDPDTAGQNVAPPRQADAGAHPQQADHRDADDGRQFLARDGARQRAAQARRQHQAT